MDMRPSLAFWYGLMENGFVAGSLMGNSLHHSTAVIQQGDKALALWQSNSVAMYGQAKIFVDQYETKWNL